jgi:MoxR-like ATPase
VVELTPEIIERKLEKIPELVNLGLLQRGKTIEELDSRLIDKGDSDQEQFANLPIWHTKKEMDRFVQEKLKLTDLQFNAITWGNGKKKIPDLVAKRISALRDPPNGLIVDWKKIDDIHSVDWRTGIWRGINSAVCADDSESKPNSILKEKVNYYIVSKPWKIWEECIRNDTFEIHLDLLNSDLLIDDVDSADSGDLIFFYQTNDPPTYFKKRGIFGIGKLIDKQIADSKCILKIKKIKIVKSDDQVIWLKGIPWTLALNHIDNQDLIKSLSQTIQNTWNITLDASSVASTIPDDVILQTKKHKSTLPFLTSEEIDDGYDEISKELLISKDKIIEIITALLSGRHVLLAGPVGTGKTRLAALIPEIFWKRWGGYASEAHTATSEWSTLDVIGGILPKIENNKPTYDIQNGCVVETVIKNSQIRTDHSKYSPDKPYCGTWLVIDEFNRAEIDKAFGQLFTALRTQELKIPTNKARKSYEDLKISDDYRIIGTLNSTDTHFLFGLSDALKSRFAYIEVGIPKRDQSETEIYYAVNNALIKLKKDSSFGKIKFDHQGKKILKAGSDEKLYKKIMQAYYTLDAIRVFKKLGTAVLQLIYQNMIVGDLISVNAVISLDNSLISTLIPQIDHESSINLNVIQALFTNDLGGFFKKQYSGINRDTYLESFKLILDYLEIPNKQNLLNLYEKNKIGKDDTVWQTIREKCRVKTDNLELNLPNWTKELNELKKSQVI